MSCKETWEAYPVYPKWTRGTYTIENDYYPDFERELYWSRCLNSGYPIQRGNMYFTPCYYEYVRDELNAGFFVMEDGVIKHYLVNYSPISHQVVWKRRQRWDYQPNVQYGVYCGSFIRMQPPKKPNMDTLECLVDILPHPKKMFKGW